MNVLALVVAALKKSGPLFAGWVVLCFATALVFELYKLPLERENLYGMALTWGGVMLLVGGVAAVVRRRRSARAKGTPADPTTGPGVAP
jgi:hypothetical protein